MSFWKAQPELAKKIKELHKLDRKMRRDAEQFAEEQGGSKEKVLISDGWGSETVSGFKFDVPPNSKFWKKVKGFEGYYAPKAKHPDSKKFQGFRSTFTGDVAKLAGMEVFKDFQVRTPGIKIHKKDVYLSLTSDALGTNCDRITDIEYEAVGKRKKTA